MRWVVTFSVARCETGLPVFAVWAPTSHFAISLKSSLFQRSRSSVWHLRSGVFSKGGGQIAAACLSHRKKSLPEPKEGLACEFVLETEQSSGWVLGLRSSLRPEPRVCGTQSSNNGGLKVIQRWDGRRKSGGVMSLSSLPEITVQVKSQQQKSTQKVTLGFELYRVTFMLSEMFIFTWDKY